MAMAMVAIGFLLLWLSVYGCVRGLGTFCFSVAYFRCVVCQFGWGSLRLRLVIVCLSTGQSLDCASGFIDRETLTARLQIRSLPEQWQWIMPDLNFTCSGTVTKLIFAARWYDGRSSYPDLQIWRPIGDGTYMKMQSNTINPSVQNSTNRYEYILKQPLEVRTGDILGIFQPSQAMIRFYIQYYPGNSQIMSYYFQNETSQFQNFSTLGRGVRGMSVLPLVNVEVETSKCSALF